MSNYSKPYSVVLGYRYDPKEPVSDVLKRFNVESDGKNWALLSAFNNGINVNPKNTTTLIGFGSNSDDLDNFITEHKDDMTSSIKFASISKLLVSKDSKDEPIAPTYIAPVDGEVLQSDNKNEPWFSSYGDKKALIGVVTLMGKPIIYITFDKMYCLSYGGEELTFIESDEPFTPEGLEKAISSIDIDDFRRFTNINLFGVSFESQLNFLKNRVPEFVNYIYAHSLELCDRIDDGSFRGDFPAVDRDHNDDDATKAHEAIATMAKVKIK